MARICNPLQTVDYQYNIRGWLRQINNIDNLEDDLFAFKINYETPTFASSTALFNGNISETFWRSTTDNMKRHYSYNYDDLNRLKEAIYGRNMNITNNYNESLWYDKNGNIEKLTRFGQNDFGMPIPLDDLIYQYKNNNQSNILTRVTETNLGNPAVGFIDGINTGDDYQYDEFGNMTSDENKGIGAIYYNHLNLPKYIDLGLKGTIEYLYNAQGVKLQKTVTTHTTQSITRYRGGFQYDNQTLQFVHTAEGYAKHTPNPSNASAYGAFDYVYNYTDHLGNIRLSYVLDPFSQELKVMEENHYYPFGLKHSYNLNKRDIGYFDHLLAGTLDLTEDTRRTRMVSNNGYQYKYNGKEYQDELGLNTTAMDFRQYDPAIGRFNGMDRLSEFTHSITPYRFALNNPNYFNDPSGLSEFAINNEDLAHCPTCPNTPAFQPLIDDPNNEYVYDPETNTATQVIELEEVVVEGKPKSSSGTDYHDVSMMFRKYSGYALTVQKPLGEAFASGTKYASQLYPSHTSNVVFQKSVLGKKVYVPLGNYNTATVGKISKTLKITGRTLGVVAVVSGGVSIYNDGLNISNGLDTTMALLALSPTGVGQAIAGTYFLLNTVSQLTTGKDIGQHIQEQIDGE